ncbi:hypothetical protein FQN54_009018 [Arachnomyces sp. PD_36]|nr:hypothetical protein FQN54_009018 [Arachnomyces sp. PD_36]
MAPPQEFYFPSLDHCFSGDSQLISWKAAFLHLSDATKDLKAEESLWAFLTHPESAQLLARRFDPFPKASPQTKSAYESKTAAINVTAAARSRYNLDEVKDDTLWLSKKTSIDEVSALRIAVLEWQSRPAGQLLGGFSEEETISLENAGTADNFRVTLGGPNPSDSLQRTARRSDSTTFLSNDARQLRLLRLYLSEKRYILKVFQLLFCSSLHQQLPSYYADSVSDKGKGKEVIRATKVEELAETVFQAHTGGREISPRECVDGIQSRIAALEKGSGWFTPEDDNHVIEVTWQENAIAEATHIMQILFLQLQSSKVIPSADILLSWLRLMASYDFLENFTPPSNGQNTLGLPFQGLVALTTLAFLKLPESILAVQENGSPQSQTPSGSTPYFLSREMIGEINEIFLNAAAQNLTAASPAVFAWSLILFPMREIALAIKEDREARQLDHALDEWASTSPAGLPPSHEQSTYEELIERARNPAFEEDFVAFLASRAVDGSHVFDTVITLATHPGLLSDLEDGGLTSSWVRLALLDLIRSSTTCLDYMPELIMAVLAILSGPDRPWILGKDNTPNHISDPKSIFLSDSIMMENFFKIAQSRFPYEAIPFLKLCRALTDCSKVDDEGLPIVAHELKNMDTFTQAVSPGFQGYETVREDENANFVSLLQPLQMIESKTNFSTSRYGTRDNALVTTTSSMVPASTSGQVISDSKPSVVMWHHRYSCLGFLGGMLDHLASNNVSGDDEVVTEVIGLLTDLVVSAQNYAKQKGTESSAKRILELASDGLDRDGDILTVVFDIFERSLQQASCAATSNRPLDTAVSCLRFIHAVADFLPGRVWPLLARSSLLGADGNGGMLAAIVSAVEVTTGDYSFLLGSIRIFDAMIDDAVKHAAMRRTCKVPSAKSDHATDFNAGVPSYIMTNILLTFTRTMIEVYTSNANWRFNNADHQLTINTTIATALEKILYYTHGIDDVSKPESKITGVFSASASYILDILRPTTDDELTFNPVVRIILDGLQTETSHTYFHKNFLFVKQVQSALKLSVKLIEVGKLLDSPLALLEKQLFKIAPVLVRLYVLHDDYKLHVLTLLNLLIARAASDPDHEPPSLLGHLGAESSCLFLDTLSIFDKPLKRITLYVAIWQFLSTLVSKRQQWLAVFLLTGSSPRHSLKHGGKSSPTMRGKPFLESSLDLLSRIDKVKPRAAAAALDFVARAQENWPWATTELRKHPNFFPNIFSYVANLKLNDCNPLDQCYNTKIAALIADLCAVYLHSAKEARDWTLFKTLIPSISWYSKNAVQVSGYNGSLHINLHKNFEMKYPGLSLLNFKRTTLEPRQLGHGYFYDTTLGGKLLGYDFAWTGSRNQGFGEEFERANLNLSLVEAQVGLLHSWKFFAIEHCADFMPDREIQKAMANVVKNCLVANCGSIPQESIFDRLQQVRVEFAMALLQRLVDIRSRGAEVFGLLRVVWDTMRSRGATYEAALLDNDTEYFRSLLNVLFLALQFHVAGKNRATPEAISQKPEVSSDAPLVLEIVKVVVAQGFRTLTTYLHDEPQNCSPKDFAILTAILQTALRVKDVDRLHEQIAYHCEDNDTARYATTLYSWSDQLTVEGDPVYGELSMLFLVELSTIPSMAEHLAVEGVLTKLSTYRLTNILRQANGSGPFDQSPRLFSIWTNGILPLCLNLLYHVIRSTPEVAAFLNQFEGQLNRATDNFANSHATTASSSSTSVRHISLSMASEAYSLALISFISDKFRQAGPSAGVDPQHLRDLKWNRAQVKEDIEELLDRRHNLRARIAPTSDKELEMTKMKPVDAGSGATNRLEERIVKELNGAVMCMGGREEE